MQYSAHPTMVWHCKGMEGYSLHSIVRSSGTQSSAVLPCEGGVELLKWAVTEWVPLHQLQPNLWTAVNHWVLFQDQYLSCSSGHLSLLACRTWFENKAKNENSVDRSNWIGEPSG